MLKIAPFYRQRCANIMSKKGSSSTSWKFPTQARKIWSPRLEESSRLSSHKVEYLAEQLSTDWQGKLRILASCSTYTEKTSQTRDQQPADVSWQLGPSLTLSGYLTKYTSNFLFVCFFLDWKHKCLSYKILIILAHICTLKIVRKIMVWVQAVIASVSVSLKSFCII